MGKPSKKQSPKLEIVDKNDHDQLTYNGSNGKTFTLHNLVSFKAKNEPQKQFMDAFFDDVPVIIQTGSAGTGKTLMSFYCGLYDVLHKETPQDKIIVVRTAVQAREIGFLKGSEEEKNEVYEAPYKSICDEIMTFKENNYNNLKAKGLIEFKNSSFLRGETFDNAIIIFDEFQNASYHELATVMTRVGQNSKVIFNGDQKQSDLHRRNDISGLGYFMKVVDHMEGHFVETVTYKPEHNLRSGVSREFLLAEEDAEQSG